MKTTRAPIPRRVLKLDSGVTPDSQEIIRLLNNGLFLHAIAAWPHFVDRAVHDATQGTERRISIGFVNLPEDG
ncbi:hypothetical protein [Cupriavidus sp. YR651]|uniref:hypothetical protein n=1 Tax=Cupriavidus sp. YR651 TaxID=1855315 RepID=UPI000B887DCE|nr:hypothetical protein [Cupriavidus sp. YR651]